jgi:hypothetical protein
MRIVRDIAVTLAFLMFVLVGWRAFLVEGILKDQLTQVKTPEISTKTLAAVGGATALIGKLNTSVDTWNSMQKENQDQLRGLLHEGRQTLLETHRATEQVNTKLIPDVLASIKSNDDNLARLTTATTTSIASFGDGMKKVTEDSDKAILAFTGVIGDPHIPIMIASMARTAGNVEGTSGDLRKISLSGVDTADQLDQSAKAFTVAVKRETRPASFALKSVTFLLGQGSNVANILKGFNVIQ